MLGKNGKLAWYGLKTQHTLYETKKLYNMNDNFNIEEYIANGCH